MSNESYQHYLDTVWDNEIDSIPDAIDWLIIKQLRSELISTDDDEVRSLTESEFDERIESNPEFRKNGCYKKPNFS